MNYLLRFQDKLGLVALVLGVTGALVVTCVLAVRRGRLPRRALDVLPLGSWLVVVALMTLLRIQGGGSAVNLSLEATVDATTVANALLFVPLGYLGYGLLARRPLLTATVACAGLSTGIELLQHFAALNRIADVNDVLANTLGGAVGACAAVVHQRTTRGNLVQSEARAGRGSSSAHVRQP